jgi:hypothetical protein
MEKYNSPEDALCEICRAIYALDKEEEFNACTKPEFDPNKHIILTKAMVEDLFKRRYKAQSSFPGLSL